MHRLNKRGICIKCLNRLTHSSGVLFLVAGRQLWLCPKSWRARALCRYYWWQMSRSTY